MKKIYLAIPLVLVLTTGCFQPKQTDNSQAPQKLATSVDTLGVKIGNLKDRIQDLEDNTMVVDKKKSDYIIYKKNSGWGPCPVEDTPCSEAVTLWSSGLLTISGQRNAQFSISTAQVIEVLTMINDSGVMNKECPAAIILDYGATYTLSTGSQEKTIQFPGCDEDTGLIEKTIDDFIDDESLPSLRGGA